MSERLTDSELNDLLSWNQKTGDAYMTAAEARSLIVEVQERRAQHTSTEVEVSLTDEDLNDEDRTALTWAREEIGGLYEDQRPSWRKHADRALSVLDRLLERKP